MKAIQTRLIDGRVARISLIVAVSILAVAGGLGAYAQLLRFAAPEVLIRYGQADGIAKAIAADRLLIEGGNRANIAQIKTLASSGAIEEPLNPTALRILGIVANAEKRPNTANRLLTLSYNLSRRDLGAQLWLIDRAVQRGDIRGALAHYDMALRISPESANLLLPILSAGLPDPVIRRDLARVLRSGPPWMLGFYNFALANSADAKSVALLLVETGELPNRPEFKELKTRMIGKLTASNDFSTARHLFKAVAGTDASLIDTVSFSKASTNELYRPISWEPVLSPGSGAAFEQNNKAVRAFANPGERAMVLHRIIFLKPGDAIFSVKEQPSFADQGSGRTWSVSCVLQGKRKIVWTGRTPFGPRPTRISERFSIPDGCDAQLLELSVIGGLGQTGMEFVISDVAISSAPRSDG